MWTVALPQSTSSPFIQIFFVSSICGSSLQSGGWASGIVPVRLAEIGRAGIREPYEVERRDRGHVTLRAGSDPDALVSEELSRHQHLGDTRRRERCNTPRLEARGCDDLLGPGHSRSPRSGGGGDLCLVRAPVTGNERQRRPAV